MGCMRVTGLVCVISLAAAFASKQRMEAIGIKHGDSSPSSLHLVEVTVPIPKNRQVLIKISYTAINRADTLQRKGMYPVPEGESQVLGLECSGEVVALAEKCDGRFKLGDKVMALLGGGGYGQYAVADERSVMPLPSVFKGDMKQAAAVPETWLTAYQLIYLVGHARPGDVVLVHAAGSGVGLAAVQLMKALGAVPVATARSAEKLVAAKAHGAAFTINTREVPDWVGRVKELTHGEGAAVILDPVGGSYSIANAEALARDGRWVSYGLMGGKQMDAPNFMGILLAKRGTLVATTLRMAPSRL